MKRFLIMRHAKSSWAEPGLDDHDRPLNGRGRKAASAMGAWIAQEGLVLDAVLLSSARRAVETWERASANWAQAPVAMGDRSLYMAWPQPIIEALRETDPDANTVMLVNHEPTVSALAEVLARPPIPEACTRAFMHFPTGAVAVLEFDGDWHRAGPQTMQFTRFQVPKEL